MKSTTAEVVSLTKEIEEKFKIDPETKQDYITLANKINEKLKTLGPRGEKKNLNLLVKKVFIKYGDIEKTVITYLSRF